MVRICVEIYSTTLRRRNQEQNRFFYKCDKGASVQCAILAPMADTLEKSRVDFYYE